MDKHRVQQLRKRANAALQRMNEIPIIKSDNIDELVHELELQQKALVAAQQQLEVSHEEYENLFDFAPLTYLVVNKHGVIHRANLTATEQFGIERNRLVGEMLASLVVFEDRDTIYLHLRRVLSTGKRQVCEVTCLRQDGSSFAAAVESVPQPGVRKAPTIRVAISDISQRKTYESRLHILRHLGDNYIFPRKTPQGGFSYCIPYKTLKNRVSFYVS